jgi:AmmeMemoRadiSam system protein A
LIAKKAGTFVSLKKHGQLRGCIGTISAATGSIAEEIINNAVSACSRDPRFHPVTSEELDELVYSVDILGDTEDIDSPNDLDVKRYGVIVTSGNKRGLLLPNLEGVDTVEQQIAISKKKAGIRESEKVELQRFEVVRHC